ncbi:MAG: methyltransferase domain-containing protein [Ignavibacteriaceae bacterium]
MNNLLRNKDFYDCIAPEYDEMISFDESVVRKKKSLSSLIKPEMRKAADLGCGTGVDSIALVSMGIEVTAFDPSVEMLSLARKNAKNTNVNLDFHNSSVDNIPENFNNKFDLAVALGNTFANIPREKFASSIKRCFEILKDDGKLVIQILNYEKIISEKKRIVNIKEGDKNYFIRFYDLVGDEIIFNILSFTKSNPGYNKLISTPILAYSTDDFSRELKSCGFNSTNFYSDFEFREFDRMQSKDLIIVSRKLRLQ